RRCDWLVVLLSANSIESIWVKREVLFALNDHRYDERIVPVLYQTCDHAQLSWTLSLLEMVDFTQGLENGFRELLRIWGIGYRNPG
ncbi:MAG TPA: toll/interleukin-1 receptor domain-containing protein, partial [Pyrinomonadaceae bacterium]